MGIEPSKDGLGGALVNFAVAMLGEEIEGFIDRALDGGAE
jgi:hypothetical protein